MAKYKTVIGRAESIDFPVCLLTDVPAKIDTGAYLSAVHATEIKEVKKSNGKTVLSFNLLGSHPSYNYSRPMEVTSYSVSNIENSFGVKQERYVIKLKVRLAGKVFISEFSLADRSSKVFPILLGRTLLNKRFIVDTDVAYISRKELKDKIKDWLKKDDLYDEKDVS